LQPPSARKHLKCIYKSDPIVPILKEKVEFLHNEPDVYQVYDVLSESAMDRIIELATPHMVRAKVVGTSADERYSTARTSTSSWIKERSDLTLSGIPRRVQSITGLSTLRPGSAEDLQVASYGIGGHYNPHLDLIFEDVSLSISVGN
jgi:prolyl 4-hydroxylase